MEKYSSKLKRALAIFMALTMAVSILAGTPLEASAASSKYVKSLSLSKSKVTINLASAGTSKSTTAKATVKVVKSASKKVTVKSSDKSVATVKVGKPSSKGVSKITITGKKAGKATITVTTKGKNKKNKAISKKIAVTVNAPAESTPEKAAEVTAINVSANPTEISIGTSTQVVAAAVPASATTTFTYTSGNPSVATVDAVGKVVGVSAGEAEITVTAANGVSSKIKITVKAIGVTGITASTGALTLTEKGTSQLSYTITPSNATDQRVTFTSSAPAIAAVSEKGEVTAVSEGSAEITIKTQDGGFEAKVSVTVKKDTKSDVSNIEAAVTNALEGYENTVLAGTRPRIDFKVTKDGAPYGNENVEVSLEHVSGHNYYELPTAYSVIKTDSNGHGSLSLSPTNNNLHPVFKNGENNQAYGSYKVKLVSGGANVTQSISVKIAQVMPDTESSYNRESTWNALTVENKYNPAFPSIDNQYASIAINTTTGKNGLRQQHVVDQQVTLGGQKHEVYLDAAPLLMLPMSKEEEQKGDYEVSLNFSQKDYSIYVAEEAANVIQDVPGGLQYLTLEFEQLQLSEHTRLVVRAYEKDTSIPIRSDSGDLVQKIVTSDKAATGSVQVGQEVFAVTGDLRYIDLWVFIESAGQVNDDQNAGYVLTSAKGVYTNEETNKYEVVRLPEAVQWETKADNAYTSEAVLENPQAYLGDYYTANDDYKVTMPAFPDTGNAIIIGYKKGTSEVDQYYMYPIKTESNENKLATSGTIFKVSTEQATKLQTQGTVDSNRYYVIDSTRAGYVHVKATVDVNGLLTGDADTNSELKYEVSSYVLFSPTPEDQIVNASEHYALAGQTVTLTATVRDSNGNLSADRNVTWEYESQSKVSDTPVTTTNKDGKATLTLQANEAADMYSVKAKAPEGLSLTMTVGTEVSPEAIANIHWVQPGLYFKEDASFTLDNDHEKEYVIYKADQKTSTAEYKVGNNWIIGSLVIGKTDVEPAIVEKITGVTTELTPMADPSWGVDFKWFTDKKDGSCVVNSTKTGESSVTASIVAELGAATPVITVTKGGVTKDYKSVGIGNIQASASLKTPMTWVPDTYKIDLIVPNSTFSIHNTETAYAYIYVHDSQNNPITSGAKVDWAIKNSQNGDVQSGKTEPNSKGYITLELDKPDAADTYTITANLENETVTADTTKTVKFTDKTEAFTLVGDPTIDTTANTITVNFSKQVDPDLMAAHKAFFVITLEDGTVINSVDDIESITVPDQTKSAVIIKLGNGRKVTSKTAVAVEPSAVEKEVETYYLTDKTDGVIYSE